ncbi:MAG: penicillin acylase family protein [Bryobacteraceae bacterium]
MHRAIFLVLAALAADAETVKLAGLKQPVEILRDRWGVPHIYARNTDDLFFANGYINARDRLFQLDTWRRIGTGKLAEVLGPQSIPRDRMARLFRYRGDWNAEWQSYAPDTRQIVTAFTKGINAYIQSLNGVRPAEFRLAGYDPGLWSPEDCVARVAALSISGNAIREVARAQQVAQKGLHAALENDLLFPKPQVTLPPGVNLAEISNEVIREFSGLMTAPIFGQGSNNWAVDGTRTASGKPLLASDPHRTLEIPSIRKTVHLVAPGWNVMGAGEPALPGIALGHNEQIAFGFTITGTDQQDLYVEKLNPKNRDQYWYQGSWKPMEIEKAKLAVKGSSPREVELRFTIHGPILYEDRVNQRAYALRWVGLEPGGAGYLSMLSGARAKNWTDFRSALSRFKVPSENMVYADTAGNIGFVVAGAAPVRKNWTGLLPVPGGGEFEWSSYIPENQMPASYNPAKHFLATANNNILPPGYSRILSYEWGQPFRVQRVEELLREPKKFRAADFEAMQLDIVSIPARRFQAILKRWKPAAGMQTAAVQRIMQWDARLTIDSVPSLIFEIWLSKLAAAFKQPTNLELLLQMIERPTSAATLGSTLDEATAEMSRFLGTNMDTWQWARASQMQFRHPLSNRQWDRGPLARPGDPNTINASAGGRAQPSGASYRQVIDLADWDRSTMTNAPGESGDPASPHYSDLLNDWAAGRYHPMPFTRKAVEAATAERILLTP